MQKSVLHERKVIYADCKKRESMEEKRNGRKKVKRETKERQTGKLRKVTKQICTGFSGWLQIKISLLA